MRRKTDTIRRLAGFFTVVIIMLSMFPSTVFAAGTATATFSQNNSSIVNGAYINANGTGMVSHKETVAGLTNGMEGNYYINGVLNNSKLLNNAITGTATTGTSSVEVMIKNLSTGKSLRLDGANGADSTYVDNDYYNAASGTTSWTLNVQGFQSWENGNYIAVARANDGEYGPSSTISFTVFNAQVVNPAFDDAIKGSYDIRVDAIDLAGVISNVYANVVNPYDGSIAATVQLPQSTSLSDSNKKVYLGTFDSGSVPDDVYTLDVHAVGTNYDGRVFQDFVVTNRVYESLLPDEPASVNPDNPREFLLDGEPFRYSGTNYYYFTMQYMRTTTTDTQAVTWLGDEQITQMTPTGTRVRFEEHVDRYFLEMKKSGLRVLRFWAYATTSANSITPNTVDGNNSYFVRALPNSGDGSPVYNPITFSRMDYILYSAQKHGILVMPTLENYWGDYGGTGLTTNYAKRRQLGGIDDPVQAPYTGTSQGASSSPHNAFFVSDGCWEVYSDLLKTFATRTGTLANGTEVTWAGHPAIFAWDLMNEPRYGMDQDNSSDARFWEGDGMDEKEYYFDYDEATDTWTWNGRLLPGYAVGSAQHNSFISNPERIGMKREDTAIYKWADRSASFLKSLDPTHMVVAGTEGQTQHNGAAPYVTNNADGSKVQMPWAGWTNQGFGGDPLGALSPPSIDFVSYHPYSYQDWAQTGVQNNTNYTRVNGGYYTPDQALGLVESLTARAEELNLPLINGELGVMPTGAFTAADGSRPNTSNGKPGIAAQYVWAWQINKAAAIKGGIAGFNVWQATLTSQNHDGLGFYVYRNAYTNSASASSFNGMLDRKFQWDYFRRAGEDIWSW